MEGGRQTSEDKVCHTCGHVGFSASIATCSLCKVFSQHTYCMHFVCFEVPEDWRCEECLMSAEEVSNRGSREVQMQQEETTRATGSASSKQEMLQFSHKSTSRKIEAGKVKFMPSEEAITLASGKRPRGNPCVSGNHCDFADSKSPPISLKAVTPAFPSSRMLKLPFRPKKGPVCTSVDISSSNKTTETKHVNMERGTKTSAQVYKTNPFKCKASSLAYNFSTCTRPNDVRCDALDSLHADDRRIRMADKPIEKKAPLEPQDDCLFILKETSNASLAIKEERASPKKIEWNAVLVNDSENKAPLEPQDDCLVIIKETANASQAIKKERVSPKKIEANALPVNDSGTPVLSISQVRQTSSQETFLPLKLIISSDEKHHHALEACWRGTFEVLDSVPQFHGTVHAHLSCQVSPKVYDISKQLPGTLQFKLLPRESVWPKIFKHNRPTKDDIALYFSCELKRNREKYAYFVQQIDSQDYALKGCIKNVELLLFTSAQLQIESQKSGGCIYLLSVFRHVRRKSASSGDEKAVSCSTSTPVHLMHDKSKTPLVVSSLEVNFKVNMVRDYPTEADMEIDMVGGRPVGRIDVPIKLEDAPSGFSKSILSPPMSFYPDKPNNMDLLDSPPGFPVPRYKQSAFASQGKTTR